MPNAPEIHDQTTIEDGIEGALLWPNCASGMHDKCPGQTETEGCLCHCHDDR